MSSASHRNLAEIMCSNFVGICMDFNREGFRHAKWVGGGSWQALSSPPAAIAAGMSSLSELVAQFSKPSICVDKRDLDKIHRGCEVLRDGLRARVMKIFRLNRDRPLLVQYGSDCTPLLTKERYQHSVGGVSVVRGGHSSHEFLIQRTFIQALGERPVALVEVPIAMACKTAYAHLGAKRQLLKNPREIGHRGLVVEFHKYDRALKSSLGRLHQQFMCACEDNHAETTSGVDSYMLSLTHWFVCEGCFVHDCHNGLKWSVLQYTKDKSVMRSCFIMHESLRHGYDLLIKHAVPWLRSVLAFKDWETTEARQFFRALDVDEVAPQRIPERCFLLKWPRGCWMGVLRACPHRKS